ncbi:hypothetical protein NPIL_491801, partial [Nephila pilipes]
GLWEQFYSDHGMACMAVSSAWIKYQAWNTLGAPSSRNRTHPWAEPQSGHLIALTRRWNIHQLSKGFVFVSLSWEAHHLDLEL